tara:strand:+ start:668 stop:823 length:156 start_codon:yes stop_codon:yes gene_type:complete
MKKRLAEMFAKEESPIALQDYTINTCGNCGCEITDEPEGVCIECYEDLNKE